MDHFQNLIKVWSNSQNIQASVGSSVVECLTRDRGAAGSSLTCVTALWSLSLELVQPWKTRPCLTDILLTGRKESNQTNKTFKQNYNLVLHYITL